MVKMVTADSVEFNNYVAIDVTGFKIMLSLSILEGIL